MIWDKLVDRCLLFTDAPGGLLKELLKEAESELSDKLMLHDSLYKIKVPGTNYGLGLRSNDSATEHNYIKLPSNYIKDIGVTHKGTNLLKMTEEEIYRNHQGQSFTGTPTAYSISGDHIVFNTAPQKDDVFILHYKSRITEQTKNKVLTLLFYTHADSLIYLDTPLGSALNNSKIYFENQARELSGGTTSNQTASAGLPDTIMSNLIVDPATIGGPAPERLVTKYTISSQLSAQGSLADDQWSNANGALVTVLNYRNVAPLIPEQFHTSLCDYAVAIANAKSAPDIYNTYWTKWTMNMDNLINEAMDRDLIHRIKEEI
jgi:hypothetical protein